jgi:hypothetical protein
VLFRLLPPLMFEIPDKWWEESGAAGFKPHDQSYRSTADAGEVILALDEIAPLLRRPGVDLDHHGFRRQGGVDGGPGGMVDVLRAIVSGVRLPPVRVRPIRGTSDEGFGYVIQDGCHRFYASHALGFTHLPCLLGSDWRSEAQFGDA